MAIVPRAGVELMQDKSKHQFSSEGSQQIYGKSEVLSSIVFVIQENIKSLHKETAASVDKE